MKWINRIFKTMLLTFLGGIVSNGIIFFINKPLSSNELSMSIGWILIITLILSFLNAIFMLLLYLTARIIQRNISDKIYSLKYLLFEIIFLYILYYLPTLLSIKRVTETWLQIFIPFIVLYVVWIIIIIACRNNTTSLFRRGE